MIDAFSTSFWAKVVVGAMAAGGAAAGIAGAAAVARTYTHEKSITVLEQRFDELDQRQRDDHDMVLELKTDIRYSREALDKLLRFHGLEAPSK